MFLLLITVTLPFCVVSLLAGKRKQESLFSVIIMSEIEIYC